MLARVARIDFLGLGPSLLEAGNVSHEEVGVQGAGILLREKVRI